MGVSLKCRYGLRALYELARHWGGGRLVRIPSIAEAQAIPERFLENILNQLRGGGFVDSRRGRGGGFILARPPAAITMAEIITFIDGQIYDVDCEGEHPIHKCRFRSSNCVFLPVWREARQCLENVYAAKTLQDLLDVDAGWSTADYSI
ncbi:MAG: Rrf2 family transcriptional regulator [Desulfovibrio sp.]|jgi:Rrf2 family protein|nr:Rrf2 family transcriptional regulator [Desulfovibrio sp.]